MFIPRTTEELSRIVEERLSETSGLDFKRQLPQRGKNDDLAVDLCAFANTEGGVIIYGIDQDDTGRATAICPFDLSGAAERIALVARSLLDEPLQVQNIVGIPTQEVSGALVVVVPQSERAPHFVKGTAWGRIGVINQPLTRRRIGELYARSPGFAEEFGLVIRRPGRVVVESVTEAEPTGGKRHYLVFKNDGDAEVYSVRARFSPLRRDEGLAPGVLNNPLPLRALPPGGQVRLQLLMHRGYNSVARGVLVGVRWQDGAGKECEGEWPVTVY